MPPAPLVLPEGPPEQVARALTRRSPEELAALAASFVALPDASAPTARTVAEVLIAARDPRARTLTAQIAASSINGADAEDGDHAWATLALLRLELESDPAPRSSSLLSRVAGLPPKAEAEALSRLLSAALETSNVHGAQWLVPIDGGRFIAHLGLAAERRPALISELGELASRLLVLTPALAVAGHPLAQAEILLAARRFDEADGLHASLEHGDRLRLSRARAELFSGAGLVLPALVPDALPDTDLERHLRELAENTRTFVAGALRERLGDAHGAARVWAELALATSGPLVGEALAAATGAVRLANALPRELRNALSTALQAGVLPDELELDRSPELRRVAELSLRLSRSTSGTEAPEALAAARLAAAMPPTFATPTAPSEADPHHPASRLAAASDLLAEGRLEPAANILAALLRKAETDTPERLFGVVAGALENDPPPDELIAAAQRALEDTPRAHRLIAALRRSATAAFALHEELLNLAKDPSRPDPLRLAALESWLNIWAETTTPPNPDLLAILREAEPALLTAAATAIGSPHRGADPVTALRAFLDARFASPAAWSDALLELMLGAR